MLSAILAIFRSLGWAWPFISEIFFEGKTFKEVVRQNKIVFVLLASMLVVTVFSLILNYFTLTALHRIINKPDKEKEKTEQVAPPGHDFGKEVNDVKDRLDRIYDEPTKH